MYYVNAEIVNNIGKISLILLRIENAYDNKNWTNF